MKERKFKKINFVLTLSVVAVLVLAMLGVIFALPSSDNNVSTANIDNLGAISLSQLPRGEESKSKSSEYEYLSDMEPVYSKVGWGSLKKDASPEEKPISLHIENVDNITYFVKGVGAHATSTLIYEVPKDKNFESFSAYLGVNADRKDQGDVVFHIYTTQIQTINYKTIEHKKEGNKEAWTETVEDSENNQWVEEAITEKNTMRKQGNSVATKAEVNVKDKTYIKLVAEDNGNQASDHAVYADAMFKVNGYNHEIKGEMPEGTFDTVAHYDVKIKNAGISDQTAKSKDLLKREYVSAIGYDLLKAYYNFNDEYKATIEWLATDSNALELYMSGGTPDNGNYGASLRMLNALYTRHKADFEMAGSVKDSTVQKGDVYKKMAISTALVFTHKHAAYLGKTDPVDGQDFNIYIDPLQRYDIYKMLHEENKLYSKIFDSLPIVNMRMVFASTIDNAEIAWLNNFITEEYNKKYKELTGKGTSDTDASMQAAKYVLDSQTYVKAYDYYEENTIIAAGGDVADRYKAPFRLSKYYTQETYDKWNEKSHLEDFGIKYDPSVARLYMLFNNDGDKKQDTKDHFMGGLCGDVSNAGVNINSALGLPSVKVTQPGHAVYMQYRENINGKGHWQVGGYDKNGIEMTGSAGLLGYGSHGWKDRNDTGSYIVLAQDVLNTGDQYTLSANYMHLANVYSDNNEKKVEIYKEALKASHKHLDAWYGLIDTYIAMNKPESTFMALAEAIVKEFKYYPIVMVDMLRIFDDTPNGVNIYKDEGEIKGDGKTVKITSPENIVKLNNLKIDTINKVIEETFVRQDDKGVNTVVGKAPVDQPEIINRIAWYLREWLKLDMATFSLSDNRLTVGQKFEGKELEYSLDGNTWTAIPGNNVVLSDKQVSTITPDYGIQVRLKSDSTHQTFKIGFEVSKAIEEANDLYANDYENTLVAKGPADFANWEYHSSKDPANVWYGYTDPYKPAIFEGDCTVTLRRKANSDVMVGKDVTKFERVNSGNGTPKTYHIVKNYLPGPKSKDFTFTAEKQDKEHTYIPMKCHNLNFVRESSYRVEFDINNPTQPKMYTTNYAFDGRPDTAWRTEYWDTKDQYITLALNEPMNISALQYFPEQNNENGRILKAEIKFGIATYKTEYDEGLGRDVKKLTGATWKGVPVNVTWANDGTPKMEEFNLTEKVDFIYIRVIEHSGSYVAASMFNLFGDADINADFIKPEPVPEPELKPIEPGEHIVVPEPDPVEPDPSEGDNQGGESGDTDNGGNETPDKPADGGQVTPTPDQGNQDGDITPDTDKPADSEGEKKDNTGMIVGITIGVVLVVAFAAIILGVYIKKRRG